MATLQFLVYRNKADQTFTHISISPSKLPENLQIYLFWFIMTTSILYKLKLFPMSCLFWSWFPKFAVSLFSHNLVIQWSQIAFAVSFLHFLAKHAYPLTTLHQCSLSLCQKSAIAHSSTKKKSRDSKILYECFSGSLKWALWCLPWLHTRNWELTLYWSLICWLNIC